MGLDIMIEEVKRNKKTGELTRKESYYWRKFWDLNTTMYDVWTKLNTGMDNSDALNYFNGVWIDLHPQVIDDLETKMGAETKAKLKYYKRMVKKHPDEGYEWDLTHWEELDKLFKNIRKDMKKGKRFVFCASW